MSRTKHAHLPSRPATPPLAAYDRCTELPRILPLWPGELADDSPRGRRPILAELRRALRAERRRGIAGHWTYDLARHVELLRVYRLELARCQAIRRCHGDARTVAAGAPPARSAEGRPPGSNV